MTIPRPLTSENNVRWFPVIVDRMARPRNNKIPWELAEIAYTEYARRYGTDQSLERIAERGGFGVMELADYLLAELKEAREKLEAVVKQAGGALEVAANDLEALDAGVAVTERGDAAPWARARQAVDRLYRILKGSK